MWLALLPLALADDVAACATRDGAACLRAAIVATDDAAARRMLVVGLGLQRPACRREVEACAQVATALRWAGAGGNIPAAARWYARACDRGHLQSCMDLGILYVYGADADPGFAVDVERGWDLCVKACLGGRSEACFLLGTLAEQAGDTGTSSFFHEKACKQGHAVGCERAAAMGPK